MLNISFDNLGPRLTKEDILQKVSEEVIYKQFCKDFPSRCFKSPFRKDSHPSFGFFKKGGTWLWKDMAKGDAGDVFKYVMLDQKIDFVAALRLIADIFHITADSKNHIIIRSRFSQSEADKQEARQRSLVQVIPKNMTIKEYAWWNRLNITPNILNAYFIRSAKEVWADKRPVWYSKEDNPIFYWVFPFSNNVKCYRPLEKNKDWKWISNASDEFDIQGYAQCQIKMNPGKPLLLTKSMKECAFFRSFHINAMAANAEGNKINPDFIRHIKKYCYPIISIYDNDEAGYLGAKRLTDLHNIPSIFINKEWGSKDPTDLWVTNYRRFYHFLNLTYDYIESIRRFGDMVETPRELRYPE